MLAMQPSGVTFPEVTHSGPLHKMEPAALRAHVLTPHILFNGADTYVTSVTASPEEVARWTVDVLEHAHLHMHQ